MSLTFAVALYAQEEPELKLAFNHLALSVKDLDASVAFYHGVLNLSELSKESRSKGVRWFSLGEGKELHLISPAYYKGAPVVINKAVHLALTTKNFDQVLKHLDSHQIPYGDWAGKSKKVEMRSDGVKQIFLQDPDGYWIEVNDNRF